MKSRWVRGLRVASLLLLAACNDSPVDTMAGVPVLPPQAAASPPAGKALGQAPDLRFLAEYRGGSRPEQVRAMIGPEGGSLRAGDFEIVVPAGAVDRATLFRIHLPVETSSGKRAYAEFESSGPFVLPVTIRLPHAETNAEPGAPILWWADDHWEALPTTPTEDGRIETTTTHFSIYGTARFFKGITTLGG